MKPYYYVYKIGGAPPVVRHENLKSAHDEAMRLATKTPGETFEILKAIAITMVSKNNTFWFNDKPEEY
jgi:hypothetical protein